MTEKTETLSEKEVIEKLADLEHQQWQNIIIYLNSLGLDNREEVLLKYSKDLSFRKYKNLSEKEKESDRVWARKVLEITKQQDKESIQNAKRRLKEEFETDSNFVLMINEIQKKIDQVFSEEFGGKLIK